MNYYYYKDPRGNVGDDLNAILIPYFFQEIIDFASNELLVGIGTIINDKLPLSDKYVIFTSGYGYQKPPNFNNKKVSALACRGPMTFEKILPYLDQAPKSVPLIDGAYLSPQVIRAKNKSKKSTGLIPHIDSLDIGLWQQIANIGGYKLIDPSLKPKEFISQLNECDKVITEAMHGAILADAYRIPWVAYYAYDHINLVKWKDWSDSLSIPLKMNKVTPIFKGDMGLPLKSKIKNSIKRGAKLIQWYNEDWTEPPRSKSSFATVEKVLSELDAIDKSEQYYLSNEKLIDSKLQHLLDNIHEYKRTRAF